MIWQGMKKIPGKSILTEKGFEVEIYMKGLGENSKIRQIYIDHINEMIS